MTDAAPKPRWYRLTPDRIVIGVLVVECLLWLSDRFAWLSWYKGYAVLAGVGLVAVAILLLLVWFVVALFFRRRCQYGIRSLLLLTVVVAMPCSWLAAEMEAARRQAEAVTWIQSSGGSVIHEGLSYPDGTQRPGEELPATTWLREQLGINFFSPVITVRLFDSEISDNDLAQSRAADATRGVVSRGDPNHGRRAGAP